MHTSWRLQWALAVVLCVALLMAPALWNGFPLLQYDTGGYLAPWFDHQLHISRSVPYGLLLVAGRAPDFWPVVLVQSAVTVWVLALTLRVHRLGSPVLLVAFTSTLCALSTLPWLSAILLTDIFGGLGVLALYLLLLRDEALGSIERIGLFALVAFAAATHSATLAVLMLLTAAAAIARLVFLTRIMPDRLAGIVGALVVATGTVFVGDDFVAGKIAWTPGGPALSFGRMLQDGIVKKYLDDHCPDPTLKLCAYRNNLPKDADDFFWGGGIFDRLGRFAELDGEMRRIAFNAVADYPWLQLKSMTSESAKQLVEVDTGAGVVNWIWNTYATIKTFTPAAVPAMNAARQQRTGLSFAAINALQVPVALLSLLLLPFAAFYTWQKKGFTDLAALNATAVLAVLGNAAVFGTFATAHNRYGARMAWVPVLVLLITFARLALQRRGGLPGAKPEATV
jgi:hypothetical protein